MAEPAKQASSAEPVFEVPRFNAFGSKILARHRNALARLAAVEARFLAEKINEIDVSEPIFVCGLARSGTTVLLEMLAKHGETASQRYLDYPFVFTPYWWNRFIGLARKGPAELAERSHKDGLMVSADSPEAMEEPIWMQFFASCHDASQSNVMDGETENPEFEEFYHAHMAKLLAVRERSRYLVKGNYHVARLGYLNKLFPGGRFILPVRDPAMHIASSMKQHKLFSRGQEQSADARLYLAQIGHFEFGLDRTPINVDAEKTQEVIELWNSGDEVGGWALYWATIHHHIADVLEGNQAVRDRAMILPYEEVCADPLAYSRAIAAHCGLGEDTSMTDWATDNIRAQKYYRPDFSDEDIARIDELTGPALARLKPHFA